jgi:hypothetical protein
MKTASKVIAICIPIILVLFLCVSCCGSAILSADLLQHPSCGIAHKQFFCSPIGPEGKRRRRRRERLKRLEAQRQQRDSLQMQGAASAPGTTTATGVRVGVGVVTGVASAAGTPVPVVSDPTGAGPRRGRAAQAMYVFTGMSRGNEPLPAYNRTPNANEVLLQQGAGATLTPTGSTGPTTPSEVDAESYPPLVVQTPSLSAVPPQSPSVTSDSLPLSVPIPLSTATTPSTTSDSPYPPPYGGSANQATT